MNSEKVIYMLFKKKNHHHNTLKILTIFKFQTLSVWVTLSLKWIKCILGIDMSINPGGEKRTV